MRAPSTPRAPGPRVSTRITSLALACLLTGVVVGALLGPARERPREVRRTPLEVVLLPWPRVPVHEPVPEQPLSDDPSHRALPTSAARSRPQPVARVSRERRDAPRAPASDPPTSPPQRPDATWIVEAPAPAASAPSSTLNLGRDVIGTAVRQARSPVRTMAQSAGADVDGEATSASQALEASIVRSAKPDCLGPNAQGSLLSIFTIAHDVVTDRCR